MARLPGWVIDWLILRPMRWAVGGTVVAAKQALLHGLAINLGGGYHHASPDHGHGFCAYADVAIAVDSLQRQEMLKPEDRIIYIDLDAHQGNGVARCFFKDSRFFIYDQYNQSLFPHDTRAQRRIDCDVPLANGVGSADYLSALTQRLPPFLASISREEPVALAIYNAGTDIYSGDALGGLNVSAAAVLERDQFVIRQLIERRIPTLVLLSGGYSRESYQLVAAMASWVLQSWGA